MGDFIAHLKGSAPLRWLVIWGGVILALVLAIHFFSRKAPGNQTLAQKVGSDTSGSDQDSGGNVTVLINGYPPAAGQVSGTAIPPVPTPTPHPTPTPTPTQPPAPVQAPSPPPATVVVSHPAPAPSAPVAAHQALAQVASRLSPAPTPAPIVHAAVKSERVARPAVEKPIPPERAHPVIEKKPVVIRPKKATAAQLRQSARSIAARLRS